MEAMSYFLDGLYAGAALALSPWLLYRRWCGGQRRGAWLVQLTGAVPRRWSTAPCVWFHGVSLGEVHLLRPLVAGFRRRYPQWSCVVSTSTDTGYQAACRQFAELPVIRWPFDFTWAVRRALRRIRPRLVVLAEGELWPNFLSAARRAGVRVALVNGRLSPKSYRRYRLLGPLARRWFGQLDLCLAQTPAYAEAYRRLGVPTERLAVTGNLKCDGVESERHNPRTAALGRLLGIQAGDLIWIAGSTQAPEEEIVLDIYQKIHLQFPRLRLLLVPRQPERFAEVAQLIQRRGLPLMRRSHLTGNGCDPKAVVLVDSVGELAAWWGLADLAFVGGSLDGRRGGQNVLEPAGYGAAVLFGPHVWNFADLCRELVACGGAIQVTDAADLERQVVQLLHHPTARAQLGEAARRWLRAQQGATQRTLDHLATLLETVLQSRAA
jgi:3-deoxy-D-manno-octulosonic-acid transferase